MLLVSMVMLLITLSEWVVFMVVSWSHEVCKRVKDQSKNSAIFAIKNNLCDHSAIYAVVIALCMSIICGSQSKINGEEAPQN